MNQETEKKEAPEEQPHPFAWGVSGWGDAAFGGATEKPPEPSGHGFAVGVSGVGVDQLGATKKED